MTTLCDHLGRDASGLCYALSTAPRRIASASRCRTNHPKTIARHGGA